MGAAVARAEDRRSAARLGDDRWGQGLGAGNLRHPGYAQPPSGAGVEGRRTRLHNHNLDSGPQYYQQVVTTRTYQDRLDTLAAVADAGVSTCCGGIVGMGETRRDRASLLHALATLPAHPDSLPINDLMHIDGTPLGDSAPLTPGIRAHNRRRAPHLSARRRASVSRPRSHEPRAAGLCFLAGANSIFVGASC